MDFRKYVNQELDSYFGERELRRILNILRLQRPFWESILAAYTQKKNNVGILELKMEIASFRQGSLLIGNYYSQFRALWIE